MRIYISVLLYPILVILAVITVLVMDWEKLSGLLLLALGGSGLALVWSMVDAVEEIRAGRAGANRFAEKTIHRFATSIFLFVVGLSAMVRGR